MKKLSILLSTLFIVISAFSQSGFNDIIFPMGRAEPIKNCKINTITDNQVDYQLGKKTFQIKAIAVKKGGEYIDLSEFSKHSEINVSKSGSMLNDSVLTVDGNTNKVINYDYHFYQDRYKKAVKGRSTGLVITLTSLALSAGGYYIAKTNGYFSHYSSEDMSGSQMLSAVLLLAGFVSFNVGFPIMITNTVKAEKNKEMLEKIKSKEKVKLSFALTNDGMGLVLEF
jgi:hypothetical protein